MPESMRLLSRPDCTNTGENRYTINLKGASMSEHVCKGDHKGHLCMLASQDKFDEIKKLAGNPKHICFNCGRVADCAENVCNPMPLD